MSRGPGRIEKTLRELFANNPTDSFTTEELVVAAFPGVNRIEKKHRVSALRAARRIVETDPNWRLTQTDSRGGLRIAYNADDLQSFGLGRLMETGARVSSWRGRTEFYQSKEAMRAKASKSSPHEAAWYRDVLIHRAQRDGDADTAVTLTAQRDADRQAFLGATRAMLANLLPRRRPRAPAASPGQRST